MADLGLRSTLRSACHSDRRREPFRPRPGL